MSVEILQGDCTTVLGLFPDDSIDSCVTDPPYHLQSIHKRFAKKGRDETSERYAAGPYGRTAAGFMGQQWDGGDVAFRPETWAEVLRVLKPGGYLLAFGGTRTYHRLACAIEDAGFDIRDMIAWTYGSGFPKSKNIGDGRGTALKPAQEPIVMARKPLVGTVAGNVERYGTGALNIDACRIEGKSTRRNNTAEMGYHGGNLAIEYATGSDIGRWPANLIHDGSEEVLAAFPDSRGQIARSSSSETRKNQNTYGEMRRGHDNQIEPRVDSGSAARFFYCAKTSKADRNDGCGELPDQLAGMRSETSGQHITRRDGGAPTVTKNNHPTVKPTDLMRYLCRLVTPPGGTVLDPFMGSGSTGRGAVLEGFGFVGIEQSADYAEIARRRIATVQP